jgi:CarD family transcriptional regulator
LGRPVLGCRGAGAALGVGPGLFITDFFPAGGGPSRGSPPAKGLTPCCKRGLGKMFSIGDLAVYPAHGVGVIEKIESQEVSGFSQDFYVMRILENDMKIMIPTKNVNNVGLREIIEKSEVPKLYNILKKRNIAVDNQTWNRRYREYMDKIKTGSVYEVAEVYRDLLMLKTEKELSFGERKMLDTARSLLVKEISLAKKVEEEQIEKDLDKIFA